MSQISNLLFPVILWISLTTCWITQLVKVKVAQSCPTLCNRINDTVHGILQARILEWVAFLFSRGIFQTQGSNPVLPHCRQILYQLSHKGSPRILDWVAYTFSSRSSQPRNRTGVSCIAGGFFTNWAIREASNPSSKIIQIGKYMWDKFSSIALTELVVTWVHQFRP